MDKEFERQVSATILQLRQRSPFFATLALFARILPSEQILTAATDGRDIFININFWQKLQPAERLGVFAHEVLHAALLHVPRCGLRQSIRWNIAADVVVNGMILAQEGFALPEGHVRNKKLEHLSVEEIYHLLSDEKNWQRRFADLLKAPPDDAKVQDTAVAPDSYSYAELEQHWRQALQQARTLNEVLKQGKLPAGLERELTHLNPAQLDWRSYLWRFLVQTPTDFAGFDRRFVGQGLYLDALAGEKLCIYIAVDTSGSVNAQLMTQLLSEVQGILQAYPHLEAVLYYADAACYGPYELASHTALPRPQGGGGTDFRPFFQAIAVNHDEQHQGVCVYLTDGYGTFPTTAPALPVLWVLTPGGIALEAVPFGESVRLISDAN